MKMVGSFFIGVRSMVEYIVGSGREGGQMSSEMDPEETIR